MPALLQTIQGGDQPDRLGAVWALTRIIGGAGFQPADQDQPGWKAAARATLRLALDDRDPNVRQSACRGIATYPDPAAVDRLLDLLQRDEPAIRREAATALGRIGNEKAIRLLLASLEDAIDRAQDHAIIYALIEINDAAGTRVGLAAKSARSRRGALLALDQMDSGDLTVDEVVPLVAADDMALQRTAAEVFSRHADWKPRSPDVIGQLLERPASFDRNAGVIRKLTTQSLANDSVAKLMGRLLSDVKTPAATRDLLLAAMADGRDLPLHESWIEPLERLLDHHDDLRTSERTLAALTAIKTDRFRDRLNQWGGDKSRPTLLRVAALEAAAGQRGTVTDASLDVLIGLLYRRPAESLQAAQKIGGAGLSKPQLIRLAPKLTRAGPSQLQELIRPFRRSQDADVARAFLAAMQEARSLTSLAPH